MKSMMVDRRIFNAPTRQFIYMISIAFIFAFGVLIALLISLELPVLEAAFAMFCAPLVFLLIVLKRFMERKSGPISIAFNDKQVVISYKIQTLEIPYDYITDITTYEKRENPTIISCKYSMAKRDRPLIFFGPGTGGEFGLELAKAFKTYMEERGNIVKVQKNYVGYVIRDYLHRYSTEK